MNDKIVRKFSIKVYDCKEINMPLNKDGKHRYEATIKASDVLGKLNGWTDINPREATLTNSKAPIKEMKKTIDELPELFIVCNRGLTVTAKQIEYSTFNKNIELMFTDKKLHGLLDGGHTYLLLGDMLKKGIDISEIYLSVQILTGFNDLNEAVKVAGGRNTSTQVKSTSLQNARDLYEPIKQVLKNKSYADEISYKETEFKLDENNERTELKKIPVVNIIAKLLCFNTLEFIDENHNPNIIYNNLRYCFDRIENESTRNQLYEFLPLLPKILELYDVIYAEMPQMYRGAKKRNLLEESDLVQFGSIPCVKTKKSVYLYELNKISSYDIPKAMIYPILAAHRVLVGKNDRGYYWEYDPVAFFKEYGYGMVTTMCKEARTTESISIVSKRSGVWKNLYLDAKLKYLELVNDRIKKIS